MSGAGHLAIGEPENSQERVRVPRTGEFTREALEAADSWEFSCPRCPRKPRVRKAALAAAARLGMGEVDVSLAD